MKIESIKTYLIEYPKKKNFPKTVYKAAYSLVEYATNQFEENTKQIEDLIRQREKNIALAGKLKDLLDVVETRQKDWKNQLKEAENLFNEDIIETLGIMGRSKSDTSPNYQDALKLINARIVNLESNLHIEIDMERIEDRSKALSYIGIEVADALKVIPTPVDYEMETETATVSENGIIANVEQPIAQETQYREETQIEVKPSLWQKIKNSKLGRAVSYVFRIKVVVDALPEGRGQN